MSPSTSVPNAARRTSTTRDLSAAAVVRGREQAQAQRDAADRQRQAADDRASQRYRQTCPATLPPRSATQAPTARTC